MTPDLDLADLDEVTRRVVDPVLAWMLRPGELVSAELLVSQEWPDTDNADWAFQRWPNNPDAVRPGDEPNGLFLVVRGDDDDEDTARLGTLNFCLHDAVDVAADLASRLQDWIAESRFGWGQLRSTDGLVLPPAPAHDRPVAGLWAGSATVELLVDGVAAEPSTLGLSDALLADLRSWASRHDAWVAAEEAEEQRRYEALTAKRSSGLSISYVTVEKAADELAAVRAAREQAQLGRWRQFVAEMEPARDDLLTRLQIELGPGYSVPLPARVR